MSDRTIILMGNGPSLADVDFADLEGYDTFGLNSAYRAYERLNWYPTYHGCFDYRVTDNHRDNFINLIENSPIIDGITHKVISLHFMIMEILERTLRPQLCVWDIIK